MPGSHRHTAGGHFFITDNNDIGNFRQFQLADLESNLFIPEISFDKIDAIRGMDITIVTTARTDEEGRALLREMGMPFRSN